MLSAKTFANELLDPEKIIENKESLTQYIQAKGSINLSGERNSNFSFKLNAPNINSVFSGIVIMKDESINGTLNTIFLSGSSEKKVPINIATNVVGFLDDVGYVSNLNQARQYLGLQRVNNQDLNNKLITQSEEKKIAKRSKLIANSFKKNTINSLEKIEDKIIEAPQIIDSSKINEVNEESKIIDINKTNDDKSKQEITNENSLKENIIPENIVPTESENSKVVQPSF